MGVPEQVRVRRGLREWVSVRMPEPEDDSERVLMCGTGQ